MGKIWEVNMAPKEVIKSWDPGSGATPGRSPLPPAIQPRRLSPPIHPIHLQRCRPCRDAEMCTDSMPPLSDTFTGGNFQFDGTVSGL